MANPTSVLGSISFLLVGSLRSRRTKSNCCLSNRWYASRWCFAMVTFCPSRASFMRSTSARAWSSSIMRALCSMLSLCLLPQRQLHGDHGATAKFALNVQTTPVFALDDLESQGKSQPDASPFLLKGAKSLLGIFHL